MGIESRVLALLATLFIGGLLLGFVALWSIL